MVPIQYRAAGRTAKEISDHIEAAIRSGVLAAGETLPSVRVLAGDLDVAPGTVAAAYKLLRERGMVQARGRHGTYVHPANMPSARAVAAPIETGVTDLASGQPDPALLPALVLPPAGVLAANGRLPLNGGVAAAPAAFVLPDVLVLAAERLAADGVPTEAITVTSGGLDGIHRVLSAHLHPGDVVAVEDPGWPNALDLVTALGLRPYPLPIDDAGPLPDPLRTALRAGARAVIVTCRAHNPTGAFLTRQRADQLRAVLAEHPQTLVIEDDHAAELAGVELSSLAGVTSSWAFIRSMSKPYGPDLRIAIVAGDQTTIARVDTRMRISCGWVSTLLQRLLLQLWTDPSATSALTNAALAYDERRDHLITALAEHGIAATGRTGLNVWVPVADETAVVSGLLRAGWAVAPGARFRQVSQPGVRITLSALTKATIPRLVNDLATAAELGVQSSYQA